MYLWRKFSQMMISARMVFAPHSKVQAQNQDGSSSEMNASELVRGVVNVTAPAITLSAALHGGKTLTLNRAAGVQVTLPVATGSGVKFTLVNGTAVSGGSTTIKVPNAAHTMTGVAVVCNDVDNSVSGFETAVDTDTVTWNGSTTGGLKGDSVELLDIAANLWWVRVNGAATGTEATPFSATV